MKSPIQNLQSSTQVFSELMLSSAEIAEAAQAIQKQGYFELAMSHLSLELLRSVQIDPPDHNSVYGFGSDAVKIEKVLGDHEMASRIEAGLTEVVEKLTQKLCALTSPLPLRTQEFCLGRPHKTLVSSWHFDRAPKVITLLATVTGSPTQYVDISISKQITNTDELNKNLQEFKPGHYYFLAAAGINKYGEGKNVPLLIHKAPGEENRTLFLARWLPKTDSRKQP